MNFFLLFIASCGVLVGLMAGFIIARRVHRRTAASQKSIAHAEQLATLGRVAAALAHELRNPLTSMRIIVQAAAGDKARIGFDAKELSILETEIERLDDSIQTFLDYARPPHPDKRRCVLQTLIEDTLSLAAHRAQQLNVEFRNELPLDPIEVKVDDQQIKQVFLNIILNALEASPDGGLITLRAIEPSDVEQSHASDRDSNRVQVEIADTGSGLPPDLGNRIFDAFVSTKDTSTGLGLAICKRIVEDHNGSLAARNSDLGGSVFVVELPVS